MGFWDKVKSLIGGEGDGAQGGRRTLGAALERRVEGIVARHVTNREPFEPIDVADEATADVVGPLLEERLADRTLLDRMRASAGGVARPGAAADLSAWVLDLAGSRP